MALLPRERYYTGSPYHYFMGDTLSTTPLLLPESPSPCSTPVHHSPTQLKTKSTSKNPFRNLLHKATALARLRSSQPGTPSSSKPERGKQLQPDPSFLETNDNYNLVAFDQNPPWPQDGKQQATTDFSHHSPVDNSPLLSPSKCLATSQRSLAANQHRETLDIPDHNLDNRQSQPLLPAGRLGLVELPGTTVDSQNNVMRPQFAGHSLDSDIDFIDEQ